MDWIVGLAVCEAFDMTKDRNIWIRPVARAREERETERMGGGGCPGRGVVTALKPVRAEQVRRRE